MSGEPVGSRTLTRSMSEKVSAATIRNVMQDLEYPRPARFPACLRREIADAAGAADVRRRTAWRCAISTEAGPRANRCHARCGDSTDIRRSRWTRVGSALSGATQVASLVLAPKHEELRSAISTLSSSPPTGRSWCWSLPMARSRTAFSPRRRDHTPSAMREAANFLNSLRRRAHGLGVAPDDRRSEIEVHRRQEIDELARQSGRKRPRDLGRMQGECQRAP